MVDKLIVGPIDKGLQKNRTAFNIDNDSFPQLYNAYQWRGRVKRKRGTSLIGQLSRYIGTTDGAGNLSVTIAPLPLGGFPSGQIHFVIGTDIFVDQGGASPVTMQTNSTGSGTFTRASGALIILGSKANTAVLYFPTLPVMGLEDFAKTDNTFPDCVSFDTTYAYNISTTFPYTITSVSFFLNPSADATNLPGYVPKASGGPLNWNGQDYQQFWTTNYQGALWATNGITTPFDTTHIGMQFKRITGVAITAAGPPAIANITIVAHGLIIGDFVFINEVGGITGINFQTGYVTAVINANTITVEFPNATLGGVYTAGGIAQYLTNNSDSTKDCIRWYNGPPTNGVIPPTFRNDFGWVNFMPPISQSAFSIADAPAAIYYLVGARMIIPFKDRLLFLGPVVQTSAVSATPIYLQDTVIYSQNGTPYYTASFTNTPNAAIDSITTATTVFHPLLVPANQTATASAYFSDSIGFGGFATAGLDQPIITVSANEDVLLLGFNPSYQVRFVFTGNDVFPFAFFVVNSELGSASTFSAVTMDQAVISRGPRGYTMASQSEVSRFDLSIPDEVFQINMAVNGNERFCAQRDFINEWIFFTYPGNKSLRFPDTTLLYNYRDDSFALFYENYTTYGTFREKTGQSWEDLVFDPWEDMTDNWESGSNTLLTPQVIAGNQQGFILKRTTDTDEDPSLYIQNISSNLVTSANHSLNEGDFVIITGAQGTIAQFVNGKIFKIFNVGPNSFRIDPSNTSGTYLGGGYLTRCYVPFIQTKQFPMAWGNGRKTRIGTQRYLLTTTFLSQITLNMYLSQDSSFAYNSGPIIPSPNVENNSLIYSQVLYTCPESLNLGLTPANTNLLQLNAIASSPMTNSQQQIWHRVNTSLIGDTVQLGFTISDDQMRTYNNIASPTAITGATTANPCVLTCNAQYAVGQLITITGVVGMTQLNNNTYQVTSSNTTTVTINVDSSAFSAYISGGSCQPIAILNATAEVELHGFVCDISSSQALT